MKYRLVTVITLTMVTLLPTSPLWAPSPTDGAWASTLDEPSDARLAQVRTELAAHPAWPQREIRAEGGFLVLPFGAGDPADYVAWTTELGNRYDGQVRRVYVQDTAGAPSLAQLEDIRQDVARDLKAITTNFGWSLGVDLAAGRVQLEYEVNDDDAFASLVAREEQTYGALFHATATTDPPRPAASLVTKGGYGTTAADTNGTSAVGCSIGFNVIKDGVYHFLTAAHCAQSDSYSGSATTPFFYAWDAGQTRSKST